MKAEYWVNVYLCNGVDIKIANAHPTREDAEYYVIEGSNYFKPLYRIRVIPK